MNVLTPFLSFIPDTIAGDFSFLLFFIAGSLASGFLLGKTRLITVVVFSYVSFSFSLILPDALFAFSPYGRSIAFAGLLIILVVVGDSILDVHIANPTSTFLGRVLIMGCLASGLVMSLLLFFIPTSLSLQFISPVVFTYFGTQTARILWMTLPLIFLLFMNRRRR